MPDTDTIAHPETPSVPCPLTDEDHITVFGKPMWFGDPFHVLPAEEWDALKAAMAAEASIGGIIGIAGGECLIMATSEGAGRFHAWYNGISQRVDTNSFLLGLFPLEIVDFFGIPGGRDRGMVIAAMAGRVYIDRDNRNWAGSLDCVTDARSCYELFEPMAQFKTK